MNPIIKALQDDLAKEREAIKDYHGCLTGDCPHEKQSECYLALIDHANEAATAFWLPLLEKAVSVIEGIVLQIEEAKGHGLYSRYSKAPIEIAKASAREFLTTLADAKKEAK